MKILVLHNAYQHRGGEDAVVEAEVALLRSAGHQVDLEIVSNRGIHDLGAKAQAFLRTPYDAARQGWARALVKETGADVVHVHNFFPLLTPAVHQGAAETGAAVVQTLHNYRLICANALFLRDGAICEKCLHGSKAWGVLHRCYRGSLPGSLAVARMQARAERTGAWRTNVHRFIALTDFARNKFIESGLPGDRIRVKPNFVEAPLAYEAQRRAGALFVGRLSAEKGVATLLEAWRDVPQMPLTVIGDGPERARLEGMAPANVAFAGPLSVECVQARMSNAACLIVPSIWYEPFGLVAIEAFAAGLPVIASNIGSLAEIIEDGVTGRLFAPGDPKDLASVVNAAVATGELPVLAEEARRTFEKKYRPERNLEMLEAIYAEAISQRSSGAN